MDIIEAIHTRRSIRKFTDQPVDEAQVTQLLQAAMSAPSAGNAQPWQFVVIEDRQTLSKIPEFHPYAAMCRQAPLAILVCGDTSLEKYPGYWVQDCSAAVQNILLAVHGLGLGAVWTGIYPDLPRVEGMRNLLGLPEQIQPLALIPIGHPDQPSGKVDRFRPERIHHDRW
ncbi:nitroreductase family protein [Desulfovibrio ferrophilus]|uniref:NADPH-flavin oxidoreductase n=1 Tax=Desulfovibrio ferrophilus TaxID=241368 RepID=A0A2Z6B0L3_9BACT|nr:nitroreductase family protein [Desulfovibrio ferrophilus]BBD08995.1 NADPH-flavin oxidoreductase [Desulfovibrio ferrophilus]